MLVNRLEIKKEENYLHVCASGRRTRETISSMAREILNASMHYEVDEILVDVRELRGRLSIFDSYLIVSREFPKLKRSAVLKNVAIVDIKENFERMRFFERVSRKLGFNIRTFTDFEMAANYLCTGTLHAIQ